MSALVIAFVVGFVNADECIGDGILDRAGGRGRALGREGNRAAGLHLAIPFAARGSPRTAGTDHPISLGPLV